MKQNIVILSVMLGGIFCGCSREVECHIQGSVDDPATTKMYLIEAGEDIRVMDNVLTIPVVDGKFQYVLKTDLIKYCELIPANQYERGSFFSAYFIAENQDVTISYAGDKVTVSGNGKEQKMVQQYNEEVGAKFLAIYDSLEAQRDSIENIIEAKMEKMTEDERHSYISEFNSENSTDPVIVRYKDIDEEYGETMFDEKAARVNWLDSHPCFYGLAEIKSKLAFANPSEDPTVQSLVLSYKNTYSKRYAGHPYHELIADLIKSKELAVGNKYIDYQVCDYEGNSVNISSLYEGKIIIIDLWASWCGPCRKHSKELIPIYGRFKDKGLQVIAIARESKKENMIAAIEKDGYPWASLIDLNGRDRIWQKNGASDRGGIIYLISADGTILAVNPTAEETEQILNEQLGE